MNNLYFDFAVAHNITPAQAVALPALFEKAAKEIGVTPRALMVMANENAEAGEYLASVCRKVGDELNAE